MLRCPKQKANDEMKLTDKDGSQSHKILFSLTGAYSRFNIIIQHSVNADDGDDERKKKRTGRRRIGMAGKPDGIDQGWALGGEGRGCEGMTANIFLLGWATLGVGGGQKKWGMKGIEGVV